MQEENPNQQINSSNNETRAELLYSQEGCAGSWKPGVPLSSSPVPLLSVSLATLSAHPGKVYPKSALGSFPNPC